jgi:hypothetical protein
MQVAGLLRRAAPRNDVKHHLRHDEPAEMLEHDPEKWVPVFPKKIMLKQRDEIMIRFNLIGS